MNQEPSYSRKAREFIEALTPPPCMKIPESALDDDEELEGAHYSTPHRSRGLEKGLSHNSIKKKMNPLERNISLWSYRKPPTNSQHLDLDMSTEGEKTTELPLKECSYLEIPSTIRDEPTDRKRIMLRRLQEQYETMKQKLDGNNLRSHRLRPRALPTRQGISFQQFQREIQRKKVKESGVQYFADLYMIKKCRERVLKNTLLEKVQKRHKPQLPPIDQKHGTSADNIIDQWINRLPEQKDFFLDLKNMSSNARKKAIQQRGPLSNIYYELAALTSDQKRNMRKNHKLSDTSPFKDLL